MRLALTALLSALALAGCGESGSDDEVAGCTIEPSTQCAGVDLSGANLEDADLTGANLTSANLTDTNLGGANLSQANLSSAQIVDADLSDADLTRANLLNATITGTNLDGATLCGTTRTDGTTDDSSCPSTTETTETTAASEAEVTELDVGDASCDEGATTTSVSVSWETEDATAVDVALDTAAPTSFGPSGEAELSVPCDGAPHAVTVTPRSDDGAGVPDTEEIETG